MHTTSFFTIPPGCAFASDLAKGILAQSKTPQELANTQIFLPTRRAVRALSTAFLQQSEGQALLLPKMMAIGDIDEEAFEFPLSDDGSLPPAIAEMRRLCLIARQVQAFPIKGYRPNEAQAFALARALIGLFDQIQNAEFEIENLQDLWPQELASHWQDIAQFLSILWQFWPQILRQEQAMDPVARRIALMSAQAQIWQEQPPETPIILAGSTGTLPATQGLMKVIAQLPKGQVVFPGLMTDIKADDWREIGKDKVHPLHPLAVTCEALSIGLSDLAIWPASDIAPHKARQQFLTEVMRPASQTDKWRDNRAMPTSLLSREPYEGLRRLEVQNNHEEAVAISLLMREALEVPEKTTILVTADRQLARMVRSELARYGVGIDDSAGDPLSQSAIGAFLTLLARLIAGQDILFHLIALADHPFSCGQTSRVQFRQQIDEIHKRYLRGALPYDDLFALHEHMAKHPELQQFLDTHILTPLRPLWALQKKAQLSLSDCADCLGQVAEAFAASAPDDEAAAVAKLWSGPDGEVAAKLLQDMTSYGHDFAVSPEAFFDIWQELAQTTEVRLPFQKQSRLAILGAVESRMVSADLVILSGLNEGTWPPKASQNLWMNQAMANQIGLPHNQWRIALSAHDFLMAASMPDVVITRARRQDDRLTMQSRWLTRMDAVMTALKVSDLIAPHIPDDIAEVLAWRRNIEARPIAPPAPKPPVHMRPTRFSATEFDVLIDDPYGLYAKKILGLRALPPLNEAPNVALKGTLFHKALQDFCQKYPDHKTGAGALDELLQMAKPLFDKWQDHYVVSFFWWPQFIAVAKWFIETESHIRQAGDISFAEIKGVVRITIGSRQFEVTAKADRIVHHKDQSATIIDYKTGQAPSKRSVAKGRSTQMLVEQALVEAGGYEALGTVQEIRALEYWQLSGREAAAGAITNVLPKQTEEGAPDILDSIAHLLTRFEDEQMPYHAEPNPAGRRKYSDYRHLARFREWRVLEVNHGE